MFYALQTVKMTIYHDVFSNRMNISRRDAPRGVFLLKKAPENPFCVSWSLSIYSYNLIDVT